MDLFFCSGRVREASGLLCTFYLCIVIDASGVQEASGFLCLLSAVHSVFSIQNSKWPSTCSMKAKNVS